ncbi:hypothetical protein BMF94_6576 [Rhodotorula taiwanensis]|uniref:G-patch domain-containing protein n=1 Tax=Rhodotorula taiwanensis TaxID=741276 RepID=A0A2S5B0X4_9BASI|nr:hypothetical protein BMF94_6576 [Rhodotorula taiwanensis]
MQGSTVASTSSNRRPAFIFSYNATDDDLPSRHLATPSPAPARPSGHSYSRSTGQDEDDDWVPTYGPTTYRRGQVKFVPAKDPQFAVLQGTTGQVGFSIEGKGTLDRQEAIKRGGPKPPAAGSEVRNLYASIVGLGASAAASTTRSAPESRRDSLSPAAAPDPNGSHVEQPRKRPRTVSPPPPPSLSPDAESLLPRAGSSSRTYSTFDKDKDKVADIVLSSDDDDDDDDDLVIMDPLTGQPEPRAPSARKPISSAAQPLLIHQLLPTASEAREKPFVPPLQYGIKSDSLGWKLLARQGWKEGLPLGPVVVAPAAAAGSKETLAGITNATPPPPPTDDRLKVPLRAVEKRDRAGIGLATSSSSSSSTSATGVQNKLVVGALGTDLTRRAREDRERERRKAARALQDKRGKGERGMDRMRKKEERERKAWIAYMNR